MTHIQHRVHAYLRTLSRGRKEHTALLTKDICHNAMVGGLISGYSIPSSLSAGTTLVLIQNGGDCQGSYIEDVPYPRDLVMAADVHNRTGGNDTIIITQEFTYVISFSSPQSLNSVRNLTSSMFQKSLKTDAPRESWLHFLDQSNISVKKHFPRDPIFIRLV